LAAIENAIREAHKITDKPKLIRVKTIIGFGMPKARHVKAHSDAPGEEAVKETKRNLGWDENKHFYVPKEVSAHFREAIKRGAQLEKDWDALVKKYEKTHGDLGKTLKETRTEQIARRLGKISAEIRQRRSESDARLFRRSHQRNCRRRSAAFRRFGGFSAVK
jgi:transketolase